MGHFVYCKIKLKILKVCCIIQQRPTWKIYSNLTNRFNVRSNHHTQKGYNRISSWSWLVMFVRNLLVFSLWPDAGDDGSSQVGDLDIPDADFLRSLRLHAARPRTPRTQVYRYTIKMDWKTAQKQNIIESPKRSRGC